MSDDELFREFDHTGDIGIELDAPTRAALFERAAVALSRIMVEPANISSTSERTYVVKAADDVELMHDVLARALTIFVADDFIWRDASVIERDGGLAVKLKGEAFDPRRHQLVTELKAVTYHELTVVNDKGQWRARIVFDV